MPCLIITGLPCCGKTTISQLVKERALKLLVSSNSSQTIIDKVVIINEENTCNDYTKNECYVTSTNEKKTRAALKSKFDRTVNSSNTNDYDNGSSNTNDTTNTNSKTKTISNTSNSNTTLVILDSLNYIKGFRYELYCVSKASNERHGILWVLNTHQQIKQWNNTRRSISKSTNGGKSDTSSYYDDNILQELIQRYEPPDKRNRWDKPLYTIDLSNSSRSRSSSRTSASTSTETTTVTATTKSDTLQQSVYNMHSLGDVLNNTRQQSSQEQQPGGSDNGNTAVVATSSHPKKKKSAFQRIKKKNPPPSTLTTTMTTSTTPPPTPTEGEEDTASNNLKVNNEKESNHQDQQQRQQKQQPSETEYQTPPLSLEEQIDNILKDFLFNNKNVKSLKEGLSTQRHIASNSNILQDVDTTTQKVITSLIKAQNSHPGSIHGGTTLTIRIPQIVQAGSKVGSKSEAITTIMNEEIILSISNYQRPRSLQELRRLRKQYLQWITLHPPTINDFISTSTNSTTPSSTLSSTKSTTSVVEGIAISFLNYIQNNNNDNNNSNSNQQETT